MNEIETLACIKLTSPLNPRRNSAVPVSPVCSVEYPKRAAAEKGLATTERAAVLPTFTEDQAATLWAVSVRATTDAKEYFMVDRLSCREARKLFRIVYRL